MTDLPWWWKERMLFAAAFIGAFIAYEADAIGNTTAIIISVAAWVAYRAIRIAHGMWIVSRPVDRKPPP
jgi:hypothetical protein